MKKNKNVSLYQMAKSALEKIAGTTLIQYDENDKASERASFLDELSKRLNASIQAQVQSKKNNELDEKPSIDKKTKEVVGIKDEKLETPIQQLANRRFDIRSLPVFEFDTQDIDNKSTSDDSEQKIDYQRTWSVAQALAKVTLEMLESMES